MASDGQFALSSESAEGAASFKKSYLRAEGGELALVYDRREASGYYTAKSAKAQVRRLTGTDMETLFWTIEPPLS